jgi:hypothetical protein
MKQSRLLFGLLALPFLACAGDGGEPDTGPAIDPGIVADPGTPADLGPLDPGPWDPGESPDVPAQPSLLVPGQRTAPLASTPLSALEEDELELVPAAPGLDLPVAEADVANLAPIKAFLHDAGFGVTQALLTDGVAALPASPTTDRFEDAYTLLKESVGGDHILVTSDSVLHLYHLFFDQLLKNAEVRYFIDDVGAMCKALAEASGGQAASLEGDLREAAVRNRAYYAVCAAILDPAWPVPEDVGGDVAATLALMDAHAGFKPNPIFVRGCPEACTVCDPMIQRQCNEQGWYCGCEDFSQYVPRGHYTQSEDLERYFKAVMWLGRIPFRIASDIETLQAVLATLLMTHVTIEVGGEAVPLAERWFRLYRVTGFFVGAADDLTFSEYEGAIRKALGDADVTVLADADALAALKDELRTLRAPTILSGLLSVYQDLTKETQGFRFMGQRFTPDGYLMGQTVSPYVKVDTTSPEYAGLRDACGIAAATACGDIDLDAVNCVCINGIDYGPYGPCRLLSRGLDVMSILGSAEADAVLAMDERYCAFRSVIDGLKTEFADYTEADWTQNAYWSWLHALKPLLADTGAGWPTFTTTTKWRTKQLRTALASWTQLRHDTILYVKQPYTPGFETSVPPAFGGYVEPVPGLFHRLAFLTAFTKDGLASLGVLPADIVPAMDRTQALLEGLRDIAIAEVEGRALTVAQQEVIETFPDAYSAIVKDLAEVFTEPPEDPNDPVMPEAAGDGLRASLVADVHTDGNTKTVLEEAVGNLDWVLVLKKAPDGAVTASIGPAFTYYEFPHPMGDRLTDEAWREMLAGDEAPDGPDWAALLYK